MANHVAEARVTKVFDDRRYTKHMHASCAGAEDRVSQMAAAKVCPECGGPIIPEGRCAYCPLCGCTSCGV